MQPVSINSARKSRASRRAFLHAKSANALLLALQHT
jgi:hypothetical protein